MLEANIQMDLHCLYMLMYLRQYVETDTLKSLSLDIDNIKGCLLEVFGDKLPYRILRYQDGLTVDVACFLIELLF